MGSMKQSALAMFLMATAMGGEQSLMRRTKRSFTQPKEKRAPKGASTYFFDINGEFSTTSMRKDECVFQCFARNDANAKKKFNRWKDDKSK